MLMFRRNNLAGLAGDCAVAALLLLLCGSVVAAQVIQVGARRPVVSLAAAAVQAKSGDTIEVDAGSYVADVAVWSQTNLTMRAVGGRARLVAMGSAAEGKAIWVVRGGAITVQGFDFVGAKVADKNGAGIRFEKGHLSIKDCTFTDNENGILTGGDKDAELLIENSEFGNNGFGDGQSHNLYVGTIKKLTVTGSYFHHAKVGHLLKSRAAENHIFYNRLTDETGGRASYELEFPNGGLAYVVGNQIQQGSQTENQTLISFGAEGYKWPRNELYLIGNVLADDLPKGGKWLAV
ncbi:right-handed parallel beta-helix repeat-containing protein, partial [bacterium]|nr:right-handed parallel beta-helix repeat-containing protein [bacterium]